jgi:RNA polymerase sigma factor (sigma-70 family)
MEAAALQSRPARARIARGPSDDALVAGVRRGDEGAFEALYETYHRNLLAFCHHMLGSREEAEDVLQHTFMAAYRHLRARGDVVGLKPWLYTIARNRCLSVLRARRDEVALEEGAAATEGLAAEVDRRADLRLLVRDVQRLAPDQRAALVLFELGDHSHDDIAAILDVRREKVKALVFQARETLMGWRAAREIPCAEVREQLATLTGSALRRGTIRRHVEQCSGCTEYAAEVRRQRAALAIVLPVAPAAGLKAVVLGTAIGGSGIAAAAGTGATGGLAGAGATGIAAKALVVAAVVTGAGATGYVAVNDLRPHRQTPAARAQRATPAAHATSASASASASAGAVAHRTTIAAFAAAPPASAHRSATTSHHMTRHGKHLAPRATASETHKSRHGQGRALGAKAPKGTAPAPGQLKAPGPRAQRKALGAEKAKVHSAPGGARPHRERLEVKHWATKHSRTKSHRAAAPKAAGKKPVLSPGKVRKHPGSHKKP